MMKPQTQWDTKSAVASRPKKCLLSLASRWVWSTCFHSSLVGNEGVGSSGSNQKDPN